MGRTLCGAAGGRADRPTDGRDGRRARWRRLRAPGGKSVTTTTVSTVLAAGAGPGRIRERGLRAEAGRGWGAGERLGGEAERRTRRLRGGSGKELEAEGKEVETEGGG